MSADADGAITEHRCLVDDEDATFQFSRTVAVFDDKIQQLIHGLKYQRRRSVGVYFGSMIGKMIEIDRDLLHIDCLVPVPLHRTRLRERGYNQSDFVTQGIAAINGLPIHNRILERLRNTKSQTTLSQEERAINVKDVFRVSRPEMEQDLCVGIVDDVMTTGATLNSCGQALIAAGAARVVGLAIARA